MWIWRQRPGLLSLFDERVAFGYSGAPAGKNDPTQQGVPNVGPIPQGIYCIQAPVDSPQHGPVALPLVILHMCPEGKGRDGFMVHGDSEAHFGFASKGCIILPRPARERIAASRDSLLVVLSGDP